MKTCKSQTHNLQVIIPKHFPLTKSIPPSVQGCMSTPSKGSNGAGTADTAMVDAGDSSPKGSTPGGKKDGKDSSKKNVPAKKGSQKEAPVIAVKDEEEEDEKNKKGTNQCSATKKRVARR
jgi:hypothetical protein